jgi:hypothetical protein
MIYSKILFFLLFILFFLHHNAAFAENNAPNFVNYRPFDTDFCTFFVDGTWTNPNAFKPCCLVHDLEYWRGGTLAEQKTSDLKLRECIADLGYPLLSHIIYHAVKLGHHSPVKTRYKYGWGRKKLVNTNIDFLELSPEEEIEFKEAYNFYIQTIDTR